VFETPLVHTLLANFRPRPYKSIILPLTFAAPTRRQTLTARKPSMRAFFPMLRVTCRFTFLLLVIDLLAGFFTAVALVLLQSFTLAQLPPWLAPYGPAVTAAIGLGMVACAAYSSHAYCLRLLKNRDGRNWKSALPRLDSETDDLVYGFMPRGFAVAVITASLWVMPWLQTRPGLALLGLTVAIAVALMWAVIAVALSCRQAQRRHEGRFLTRARPM
jgi:hypothetical protein